MQCKHYETWITEHNNMRFLAFRGVLGDNFLMANRELREPKALKAEIYNVTDQDPVSGKCPLVAQKFKGEAEWRTVNYL